MRDIELYKAILGLTPPWTVVNVELDVKGQDVTVRVRAGDGPFACPECHAAVPGYDRKPPPLAAPGHLPIHDLDRGRGP